MYLWGAARHVFRGYVHVWPRLGSRERFLNFRPIVFANMSNQRWSYPTVRRDETMKEDHFGTCVPDPYRWLEDPDSDETAAFVAAQNNISQPYLAACEVRDRFHARYIISQLPTD